MGLQSVVRHLLKRRSRTEMLQAEDIYKSEYANGQEIGRGKFSIVYEVQHRTTGEKFAAKHIKTRRRDDRQMALHEISILNDVSHPHILHLEAAFEINSKREICLITEFLDGGELFEKVISPDFDLTEKECALFMRQICQAVAYLHEKKIVHLDLKPENVVVCSPDSDQVKIVDFGFARLVPEKDAELKVICGTPEFMAPEVLNFDPVCFKSDIWSVGVIAYVLLSGLSPFLGDSDAETCANVTRAEPVTFDDDPEFDEISDKAKSFITSTIVKKKEDRLDAEQCLEHPWLQSLDDLNSGKILKKDNLKRFVARRRWLKFGNMVSAINRMSIQTKTGKCGSQDEPPDQSTDQDSNPSLEGDSPEEESGQFIFGQTYRSSADLIFE